MKRIYKVLPIVLVGCLTAASCSSDWDDHYDESGISLAEGSDVVIYNGSVADYIGSEHTQRREPRGSTRSSCAPTTAMTKAR